MNESPDAIRAEIERTRRSLGADTDALVDKVTPGKIVDRQKDKVRSKFGSFKERVMGAADDASGSASDVAGRASDAAHDAAHTVKAKAEGNPLAVGLIAFGVGLVAASLIPSSEKEKELSQTLREEAQPLVDEATAAAKSVASNLQDPAAEAAQAVKESATEAVDHVKSEATSASEDVQSQAGEARDRISGQ
ncbi:DUF3618 domain-containing protein [Leucobacter chromiiresistens]|uniref:DUF3618 domain-containing protein n=1 Tax=Leucobacter chromiiresistens TaxID=1079994 RepID=A0A147EN46_9MICO|nr:DUF3618 domain-containing protein [Leucobacter chromiiresistens]KTR85742.1 hypothetical protein NS354_08005 [Leucobacter chromiiresistens]